MDLPSYPGDDHKMKNDLSPEMKVGEICRNKKWRLAVAESCTGGLLGGKITSVPGSSGYFAGGIIAYSNHLKQVLLKVPEELIIEHGAVSEPVAVAMARGAIKIAGAHIAVSITGVAGPEGTEAKPPGTVFIALVTPGVEKCLSLDIPGNREQVREAAVDRALNLIIEVASD